MDWNDFAGGGVPDAPCQCTETPCRAVEDAGPYGECAVVGGGVPDAPCQRTDTPCRAVEDAGPYGRKPTFQPGKRAVGDAGPYGRKHGAIGVCSRRTCSSASRARWAMARFLLAFPLTRRPSGGRMPKFTFIGWKCVTEASLT